jgi:transcriptional regulator with XRE-family HTH domain
MINTIGNTISNLRKAKNLTQSELAEKLGVSAQAVSKWENDLAYPDITLLAPLSEILGCSIDDLLKGEHTAETVIVPPDKRKNIEDLIFKIRILDGGTKVNVNLPMALLTVLKDSDTNFIEFTGDSNAKYLQSIDFDKLIALAEQGVLGKLVEIEDEDGTQVEIYVE